MENLLLLLEKFQPTINEIAIKMGIATEELWRILLRQQLVDGFINFSLFIIGLIMLYYSIKFCKWCLTQDEPIIVVAMLFTVVSLIIMIGGLFGAISHFVNPEYQAIKDIFKIINPPR